MVSEISSLQTSNLYEYLQNLRNNSTVTETKQVTDSADQDTLTISNEAFNYMSKPPALDFEAMSDEEFSDWLSHMQQETGSIPGAQDAESISELTSEQLQELKELLAKEQEEREQAKFEEEQQFSMLNSKMQNALSSYETSMQYGSTAFQSA